MTQHYDISQKLIRVVYSALIGLVLALAPAARADFAAQDDTILFEPGAGYVDIPHAFLLENDSREAVSVHLPFTGGLPVHGTVVALGDVFRYIPSATNGLESLRTDSFGYVIQNESFEAYATVHVVLRTDDVVLQQIGFEVGEPVTYETFAPAGTTVATLSEAAMVGGQGLNIKVPFGASEAFIEIEDETRPSPESGRVIVAGENMNIIDQDVMIVGVGPSRVAGGDEALRVVLRPGDEGGVEIVVEAFNGWIFTTSASLPVGPGPHHVDLDWWPATPGPGGKPGGAILRLDGEAVELQFALQAGLDLTAVQVGVMPLGAGLASFDLDFDHVVVYQQGQTLGETIVFGDDFEANDLDPGWDGGHGDGAPVSSGGAIAGNFGLLADLAQSSSYHVADDPLAETVLNARFRLDVSGLSLQDQQHLRLFDFGSDADPVYGIPDVNIRLMSLGDVPHVAAVGVEWSGLVTTPWKPLSGTHTVELQWRGSLGSLPSGYFRLWLDGLPVGAQMRLDSFTEAVEWLHFGVLGVDQTSRGSVKLDDLVIWR